MKIHDLSLALLGVFSLCLAGCANDNTLLPEPSDNDGHYAVMTLAVKGTNSLPILSRWVPPTESAVSNEGKIHDAFVIIYETSLNDANLSSTEKPLQVEKVTLGSPTDGVYSVPRFRLNKAVVDYAEANSSAPNLHVLVLANVNGESYTTSYFANKELKTLRDETYTGAICTGAVNGTNNVKAADRFTMTSDVERTFAVNLRGTTDISDDVVNTLDGPIVVERLAARIDICFGKPIVYGSNGKVESEGTEYYSVNGTEESLVTFTNGKKNQSVNKIVLPVYDYTQYKAGNLVRTYDTYVISGINVTNAVTVKERFIQHTNVKDPANYPNYFADEAWSQKTGSYTIEGQTYYFDGWYAIGNVDAGTGISRVTESNHTLANLTNDNNNLYSKDGYLYYTLGYYAENTGNNGKLLPEDSPTLEATMASVYDKKTAVNIVGTYKKAKELGSGSKDVTVNLTRYILHCHPDDSKTVGDVTYPIYPRFTGSMVYAVGRNTIYRICIDKVLRDTENVYVIWYYDSNNDGTFEKYTTTTPFADFIVDSNASPVD